MPRRFPMPIPFGWYAVAYADELMASELKIASAFFLVRR